MDDALLDAPVRHSLTGAHRALAIVDGRAARYPAAISPFTALPADPTPQDWAALARLAGDDVAVLVNPPEEIPAGWELVRALVGFQMIGARDIAVRPVIDREIGGLAVTRLGPEDGADMLGLTQRTEPGPFGPRTGELGTFFGVRDGGALVAMAGERLHPTGWTEVSGVCTDATHRGRGLARALMETVIEGILARGERPFLHVVAGNPAMRLYESMGFVTRRPITIGVYRPVPPADPRTAR